MNRAIFLDRDGVINALVYRQEEGIFDSPYSLEEFNLLPGVAEAIRLINSMGFLAMAVSNQPGVAKGKCDAAMLDRLTLHMCRKLEEQGAHLDGIYYCLHHPDGVIDDLRRVCDCRKPKPGLLLRAAREHDIDLSHSYMIGDGPKDIEAGLAAGCTTILVRGDARGVGEALQACQPHWIANNLPDAVTKLRQKEGEHGDIHRLSELGRDRAVAGVWRRRWRNHQP